MKFLTQTQLCTQTHSFSGVTLGDHPELVLWLLTLKSRAAHNNAKLNQITQQDADVIKQACHHLQNNFKANDYPVDIYQGGGGIAVHININEHIQKTIFDLTDTELPLTTINHSQSTTDVLATALRLTLIDKLSCLLDSVSNSTRIFTALKTQHLTTFTLARTCLQDAGITSYGERFAAIVSVLIRQQQKLHTQQQQLTNLRIGSTAIGNFQNSSKAFQAAMIEQLNNEHNLTLNACENAIDQCQHADDYFDVSQQLASLSLILIKVCKDLRLLSSGPNGGFGEIKLPTIIQGSSFYKDKSNPTQIETLMQACFKVLGNQRIAEATLEHAELDLNVFDIQLSVTLLESLDWLTTALAQCNQYTFSNISVNEARCQTLANFANPTKQEVPHATDTRFSQTPTG